MARRSRNKTQRLKEKAVAQKRSLERRETETQRKAREDALEVAVSNLQSRDESRKVQLSEFKGQLEWTQDQLDNSEQKRRLTVSIAKVKISTLKEQLRNSSSSSTTASNENASSSAVAPVEIRFQ
eukprot:g20913.t1